MASCFTLLTSLAGHPVGGDRVQVVSRGAVEALVRQDVGQDHRGRSDARHRRNGRGGRGAGGGVAGHRGAEYNDTRASTIHDSESKYVIFIC